MILLILARITGVSHPCLLLTGLLFTSGFDKMLFVQNDVALATGTVTPSNFLTHNSQILQFPVAFSEKNL
jgi:hypothetical protein